MQVERRQLAAAILFLILFYRQLFENFNYWSNSVMYRAVMQYAMLQCGANF
jgi:hypothetical protein